MTTLLMRHLLFMFLGSISLLGCAGERPELPTRQECIVKATVLPSKVGGVDREIAKDLFSFARRLEIPLAAYSFDRSDNLYMQFSKECTHKHELAVRLLKTSSDFAIFEVTDDVVTPSTKTIEVSGSSWRDTTD